MAGRGLAAQVGPKLVPPAQRGPDFRLPEIELPDLLLELDGKPLMEGTYVRADLVGARETTRIEGRIDKAGRLQLGKTRNLGLLRGCELRITANFLPLRPDQKKLIPTPVGREKKQPKFPNWFQCIRPLTLETSPVHCTLERKEPYLLGMGQLFDAHKRPMPDVDVSALSSREADRDTIVDGTDANEPSPRAWPRHYLPVTILGGAETDALGTLEARDTHLSPQRFVVDSLAYVSTRSGRDACGPSGPSLVGSSGARLPPESGVDSGV